MNNQNKLLSLSRKGRLIVVAGLIVNTVLAVVKILAGLLGNSYALVADGIESVLDIFGAAIVWGGLKYAARPPDENHPYGHGKAESLAALVVGLSLLGATVGITIQSIREILAPLYSPAPYTLIVLVVVIITKEFLARITARVATDINSTAIKADALHHRSDALTSAAAFIGISIALIGGPAYAGADDWAALFAAAVIGVNGLNILRHALADIMDEAASPELETKIRSLAEQVSGVVKSEKCFIRKSGLLYLVDIHIMVPGNLTVHQGHEIARQVRRNLSQSDLHIKDALVHVEPIEV